jgi:hypothetical protein
MSEKAMYVWQTFIVAVCCVGAIAIIAHCDTFTHEVARDCEMRLEECRLVSRGCQ